MTDRKNQLQEYFQKHNLPLPSYETIPIDNKQSISWQSNVTITMHTGTRSFDGKICVSKTQAEMSAASGALTYVKKYRDAYGDHRPHALYLTEGKEDETRRVGDVYMGSIEREIPILAPGSERPTGVGGALLRSERFSEPRTPGSRSEVTRRRDTQNIVREDESARLSRVPTGREIQSPNDLRESAERSGTRMNEVEYVGERGYDVHRRGYEEWDDGYRERALQRCQPYAEDTHLYYVSLPHHSTSSSSRPEGVLWEPPRRPSPKATSSPSADRPPRRVGENQKGRDNVINPQTLFYTPRTTEFPREGTREIPAEDHALSEIVVFQDSPPTARFLESKSSQTQKIIPSSGTIKILPRPTPRLEETHLVEASVPAPRRGRRLKKDTAMVVDVENKPKIIEETLRLELPDNFWIYAFVGKHHPQSSAVDNISNQRVTKIISTCTRKDGTDTCMQMYVAALLIDETFEVYLPCSHDHFAANIVDMVHNEDDIMPWKSQQAQLVTTAKLVRAALDRIGYC